MGKKNVLVLATYDEKGQGHGRYLTDVLRNAGLNSEFICLVRRFDDTEKFFIDLTRPYHIKTLFYKAVIFLSKLLFFRNVEMRALYKGEDIFVNYKDVLKKASFVPDFIVICQHVYFLSPKDIYNIWKATGAEITMIMVDPRIITGGCPFPNDCRKYLSGCKDCDLYPYLKCIPKNVFNKKQKYLSSIPFHLVGTNYDLKRTIDVEFLNNKEKHGVVGMPILPFELQKNEARKFFGLEENDFVIMAGATYTHVPAKGYKEMIAAIHIFAEHIKDRKVKFLLLGKIDEKPNLPSCVEVITPGYLEFNGMFTAFYACDTFLSPSIEDSGPFMVNYSMACHRPVVAFDVGIAQDLVVSKKTGWLAKLVDIQDFAEGIRYFYGMTKEDLERVNENCYNHLMSFQKHPWYEFMLR